MEKPAEGGRVEAPAKRPRFDALTSLRFVAAAMIVLHHLKGNMGVPLSLPFPFGHGMRFGVSVFFLLSGFVLAYNYPSLPTPHARRRFLVTVRATVARPRMAGCGDTLEETDTATCL